MGKSSKKPRKKLDSKQLSGGSAKPKKKESDWSFDDIARSKTRRY